MPSTTIYANKGARIARRSSDGWEAGAGSSDYLPTGLYSGYLYRTLLGFSYSFTGWTAISSATLNIRTSTQFYVAFGSDPDIYVYRLTSSFSEGSSSSLSSSNAVRWDNAPGVTQTNRASLDVSTAESDWVSVDITAIMQDALEAGVFYGLRLNAQDESTSSDVSEFYSDDTTSEPYITITYSTNTAPNAPTNLAPTGSAVNHNLTPVLTGTFSDPDAGDTMTGVQIVVYEDNGTTVKWDSGMVSATGPTFARQYTGPSLTGNTFYKWKARTKDAAGAIGAYSAQQRFKVNSVPYAPTTSISGSASDQTDLTPSLYVTHNDADATDQNFTAYRITAHRVSDSSLIWDTGDVAASGHTLIAPYSGPALSWQTQYYFQARTKDSNGAWSPYSAPYYFTTHTTGIPTSLSPANGFVAGSLTPTLSGARSKSNDSLTNVEIEVYESDGTTLKWASGSLSTGSTTSFAKVYSGPALTGSADYKWRARVTSSVGGTSAWSALQLFQAPDTNAATITTPIGPDIADLTPDLTFTRGVAFVDHELEVYESDGVTLLWTDGPASYASTTSKAVTYAGPALDWATEYRWRVRVSADGSVFSPWTGLVSFTTDAAGIPTLTNPADGAWETELSPNFEGTTADSEVIDTFHIIVYESDQTTVVWDSGDIVAIPQDTDFSQAYNGSSSLVKGAQYWWKASYVTTAGVPGEFSVPQSFHINADPSAPSNLIPASGAIVADTLTPDFYATFEDADISLWGDTPTEYEVEVYRVSDDTLMHALSKTVGLEPGQNSVARVAEGTALSYEVEYSWRARYTDSLSVVGPWSALRVFKPTESPVIAVTAPGATVTSPAFTVTWTVTSPGGKSQSKYRVSVNRADDGIPVYDTGEVVSSALTFDLPAGYLLNGVTYDVVVTAWDTDGVIAVDGTDPTQTFGVASTTADWVAPSPPADFSAAPDPATSTVRLTWTISGLDEADFAYYAIYRRVVGDETWTPYAVVTTQSTVEYIDQYAANGVLYDYKVTQFQHVPGDADLESEEESIASAILDVDEWFVIGADGAADHSFELPVYQEGHQQPVQQEVFEPLGSRRKKSARGNTLGNEGTLDMTFTKDEREDAKRRLLYLAESAGPHILKSPFGDVWQVEFSGPVFKYTGAGHLSVTLAFIEVA